MARRKVTQSGKDSDGDITALCNPAEAWSPRMKQDAIRDIETRTHSYYVQQPGTDPAEVTVVGSGSDKHLRTAPDADQRNNLDNLPDC